MRKLAIPLALCALSLAGTAQAATFQPIGNLGIGGAGVARTTNALAAYWNPAGLAFNETSFSMPVEVSAGLRVSKGLADNVDKIEKFTEKGANGLSTFDKFKDINAHPEALGDVIAMLAVFKDIEDKKGTVSLEANTEFAMQIKHFAFGAFGNMEGFARPDIDLKNVLPATTVNGVTTPASISQITTATAGASQNGAYSYQFFTDATQRSNLLSQLEAAGFSATGAQDFLATADKTLYGNTQSGSTISPTPPNNAAAGITDLLNAFTGSGGSIDNNRTAVVLRNLAYVEFPIAYGHPIDLGGYGKLGIGASVKPIVGRVYSSELLLVNQGSSVSSGNITSNLTKNYTESTAVTFDLGMFYKYSDWFNFGLVGKNLTSPKFSAPPLKDQHGNLVATDANGNPVDNSGVVLKPQVRAGISLDPLSWLTIAADLDLTKNDTVLPSADYTSRNLGGGLELHPFTWLKLRGGMYKNLANNDVGPVATAGLSLGIKWFYFDIDGAYGLETAKFKEKNYPKEARVQTTLNIQF
ncbi:conjugal transfer protein TraF [Geomonas sp. Red32]|uniref:conjugal transfer protein TraF n=1 Tax=Geomonas sp. Red32 TaxID=2912856 RepID=UPI00202CEEC7|nr:conjugal transfer protein TraF [Geomonas sp. Red32]MCM0081003.1 conjugal transfer protein TraF [Geomonas sp. Red32]